MDGTANEPLEVDWGDVYPRLLAYARWFLKNLEWFRDARRDTFLKGKQPEDYVMEAIAEYLEKPERYKASEGRSLVNYLKLHILRRLISNDAVSSENKSMKDLLSDTPDEEDGSYPDFETFLSGSAALFDEELDYVEIMESVAKDVSSDAVAEQVYLGVCVMGMKRREVMEEFGLSAQDYDNGMRRLRTVLKNTARKYGIKQGAI